MIEISVIIVNYKSKESLLGCVGSIFQKFGEYFEWEIVIVNNDIEESLEVLEKKEKIKIINLDRNIGFGAAANVGAETAAGRFLFFLNPDAKVISGQLNQIISEFDSNHKIGVCGFKIVDAKGNVEPWSAGKEIGWWQLVLNNFGLSKSREIWESRTKKAADWVSGGAFFVRREIFCDLGGFDKDFFMYFEDMDLCKRLREKGFFVVYYPEFQVEHEGGRSFENKKTQKECYYNSLEKYFKKHKSKMATKSLQFIRKQFF